MDLFCIKYICTSCFWLWWWQRAPLSSRFYIEYCTYESFISIKSTRFSFLIFRQIFISDKCCFNRISQAGKYSVRFVQKYYLHLLQNVTFTTQPAIACSKYFTPFFHFSKLFKISHPRISNTKAILKKIYPVLEKSRMYIRNILEIINFTNRRTLLFFKKYAHEHTFSVSWVREVT